MNGPGGVGPGWRNEGPQDESTPTDRLANNPAKYRNRRSREPGADRPIRPIGADRFAVERGLR
jgi:hypothetical protein